MFVTRLTDRIRVTFTRSDWKRYGSRTQLEMLRLSAESLHFKDGTRRLFFTTSAWHDARKFFPQLTRSDKR